MAGKIWTHDEEKLKAIAERADRETRARRLERERALRERVGQAREEVARLVLEIQAADPGVRRIVLFGSLARNSVKRLSFDIDLAVDSDHHLRLTDVALESPFKVDLVDLTSCSEYVTEAVERDGVELYRAEQG